MTAYILSYSILMVESDHDEPLPFAFAMIQHLVSKFGPQNVFIVSKAGPIMEQEIRQWLERTDIYERTGFQQSQVIFVREYSDKAQVVQELKISIFFDDSVKVVRCLAPLPEIDRVFWMYANPRDVLLIPKEHRSKVAITKRWSTTMKYLQKISSR